MTKINSKLMIDYDDNNSYLDFITEKEIKYYIKSTVEYKDYIITYIITLDSIKPVSIQQKLNNNISKVWEYSDKLAESLEIKEGKFFNILIDELKAISHYHLAIDTIEEEIKEYIKNEYEASRISYKEYERKLDGEGEDDDITRTIENIQDMIEKEYGENATLAEIKQDSEYRYNLLIASTYLRTKHKL